ncbi:MAG TPA: hypothetical protein VNG12_10830 [Acidimicrobiales bacterium]|nr:hypothetical protein [Acidimicrobiales bacterium]
MSDYWSPAPGEMCCECNGPFEDGEAVVTLYNITAHQECICGRTVRHWVTDERGEG